MLSNQALFQSVHYIDRFLESIRNLIEQCLFSKVVFLRIFSISLRIKDNRYKCVGERISVALLGNPSCSLFWLDIKLRIPESYFLSTHPLLLCKVLHSFHTH